MLSLKKQKRHRISKVEEKITTWKISDTASHKWQCRQHQNRKGWTCKPKETEKTQKSLQSWGEKSPEKSKKQKDSTSDSSAESVTTSGGEAEVTEKQVDETLSNQPPKAQETTSDAKPEQKDTNESKEKMPEKAEEVDSVMSKGSGTSKDVKSEETVQKDKDLDSGAHDVKAAKSETSPKIEAKALEKTEQVKDSSQEDNMDTKGPEETTKPSSLK